MKTWSLEDPTEEDLKGKRNFPRCSEAEKDAPEEAEWLGEDF